MKFNWGPVKWFISYRDVVYMTITLCSALIVVIFQSHLGYRFTNS